MEKNTANVFPSFYGAKRAKKFLNNKFPPSVIQIQKKKLGGLILPVNGMNAEPTHATHRAGTPKYEDGQHKLVRRKEQKKKNCENEI